MHELSIMEDVLRVAVDTATKNGANEITKITIHAGGLANIIPKWGTLFFRMISKDTMAQNAEVEFVTLPAYVVCRDCGKKTEMQVSPPVFVCGACGSGEVKLVSGREFSVESIEVK